jgi:hypothetical protein
MSRFDTRVDVFRTGSIAALAVWASGHVVTVRLDITVEGKV